MNVNMNQGLLDTLFNINHPHIIKRCPPTKLNGYEKG